MATKLTKRIVRETTFSFGKGGKPLMVALLPGDLIEIWSKKERTKWTLPIEAARSLAIKMYVADQKRQKAEKKAARRKK